MEFVEKFVVDEGLIDCRRLKKGFELFVEIADVVWECCLNGQVMKYSVVCLDVTLECTLVMLFPYLLLTLSLTCVTSGTGAAQWTLTPVDAALQRALTTGRTVQFTRTQSRP